MGFHGAFGGAVIYGGTIIGATIETAAAGRRIVLSSSQVNAIKFYTGATPELAPGLLQVATLGGGIPTTGLLLLQGPDWGSTNGPPSLQLGANHVTLLSSASLTADIVQVNAQSLWGPDIQGVNGPGNAGIVAETTVTTLVMPSYPYPTRQRVTGANWIQQTVAGDFFTMALKKGGVAQGYSRISVGSVANGASLPPICLPFDVPANTAVTYDLTIRREAGTGSASTTAVAGYNYLIVDVLRNGA